MAVSVGAPADIGIAIGGGGDLEPPYAISVPLLTGPATKQLHQGTGRWLGWALIDPSGAVAAVVELYDGMDAGSQLLCVAGVAAGATAQPILEFEGVAFKSGLFLNVVSGQVRGVVYARLRSEV